MPEANARDRNGDSVRCRVVVSDQPARSCHRFVGAGAQGSADPNPGARDASPVGSISRTRTSFAGFPQDDTGVVMWPYGRPGLRAALPGDGVLKSAGVNVGMWNSLHTGGAGSDGPSGKLWYESDFYADVASGTCEGHEPRRACIRRTPARTGCSGPSRRCPSGWRSTTAAHSDGRRSGRTCSLAQELEGQADGGAFEGTYLELGIASWLFDRSRAECDCSAARWASASVTTTKALDGDETFRFFQRRRRRDGPAHEHADAVRQLERSRRCRVPEAGRSERGCLRRQSQCDWLIGIGLSY